MPHLKVNGVDVYHEISGSGEPLLFLHNGLGCTKNFSHQIEELSKHFTAITYDRQGYGQSTHTARVERDWLNSSVKELSSFLDRLGIEEIRICGVCVGGAIALLFAASNPSRTAAVAAAGTCCYGEENTTSRVQRFYPPRESLPEGFLHELARCHGDAYAGVLYDIFYQAIEEKSGYPFISYDLRPTLSRVRCPVLILHGDRDPLFDLEQALSMYTHLPDAELCVFPGCGHLPNEERSQDFNRELLRFIHKHKSNRKPGRP